MLTGTLWWSLRGVQTGGKGLSWGTRAPVRTLVQASREGDPGY